MGDFINGHKYYREVNHTDLFTSYRPISLLPVLLKVLETLILKRLQPIYEGRNLLPNHQFGFHTGHGTIEQTHRIVNQIHNDLTRKMYYSAVFADISQALDKIWHIGLRYKLKLNLPHPMYALLTSYLADRYFFVKHEEAYTDLLPVLSGVPQGSIVGPLLYTMYTADLPITRLTTTATYADGTAILASHYTAAGAAHPGTYNFI